MHAQTAGLGPGANGCGPSYASTDRPAGRHPLRHIVRDLFYQSHSATQGFFYAQCSRFPASCDVCSLSGLDAHRTGGEAQHSHTHTQSDISNTIGEESPAGLQERRVLSEVVAPSGPTRPTVASWEFGHRCCENESHIVRPPNVSFPPRHTESTSRVLPRSACRKKR